MSVKKPAWWALTTGEVHTGGENSVRRPRREQEPSETKGLELRVKEGREGMKGKGRCGHSQSTQNAQLRSLEVWTCSAGMGGATSLVNRQMF